MTDIHGNHAPAGVTPPADGQTDVRSGLLVYSIGLALAVILTITSFWAANTSLLWPAGVPLAR